MLKFWKHSAVFIHSWSKSRNLRPRGHLCLQCPQYPCWSKPPQRLRATIWVQIWQPRERTTETPLILKGRRHTPYSSRKPREGVLLPISGCVRGEAVYLWGENLSYIWVAEAVVFTPGLRISLLNLLLYILVSCMKRRTGRIPKASIEGHRTFSDNGGKGKTLVRPKRTLLRSKRAVRRLDRRPSDRQLCTHPGGGRWQGSARDIWRSSAGRWPSARRAPKTHQKRPCSSESTRVRGSRAGRSNRWWGPCFHPSSPDPTLQWSQHVGVRRLQRDYTPSSLKLEPGRRICDLSQSLAGLDFKTKVSQEGAGKGNVTRDSGSYAERKHPPSQNAYSSLLWFHAGSPVTFWSKRKYPCLKEFP